MHKRKTLLIFRKQEVCYSHCWRDDLCGVFIHLILKSHQFLLTASQTLQLLLQKSGGVLRTTQRRTGTLQKGVYSFYCLPFLWRTNTTKRYWYSESVIWLLAVHCLSCSSRFSNSSSLCFFSSSMSSSFLLALSSIWVVSRQKRFKIMCRSSKKEFILILE